MKRGKAICEALKDVRRKIARANSISYTPNECHHEGECAGTCPACEREMRYLERQLSLRQLAGQTIRVAGVSLGMMAVLSSCHIAQPNGYMEGERIPHDSTESVGTDTTTTVEQVAPVLKAE